MAKVIINRNEIRAKFNIPADIVIEIPRQKKVGRKIGATKKNGYKQPR